MNKKKYLLALASVLFFSGAISQFANAGEFTCPAASEVRCVPAKTPLGNWKANGGEMTGNSFAENNQCANVIPLGSNLTRLICCYTKCGVFFQDVRSRSGKCVKIDESRFHCD